MKIKKIINILAGILPVIFVILSIIAIKKKKDSVYEDQPDEKNPLEGKRVVFVEDEDKPENADGLRGYLQTTGESSFNPGIYGSSK